jgi:hypothetical protein
MKSLIYYDTVVIVFLLTKKVTDTVYWNNEIAYLLWQSLVAFVPLSYEYKFPLIKESVHKLHWNNIIVYILWQYY